MIGRPKCKHSSTLGPSIQDKVTVVSTPQIRKINPIKFLYSFVKDHNIVVAAKAPMFAEK